MILNNQQKNRGFTIVEAMVAILILTISVSAMLGITASSAASARYANNEITANYLLQEAVDSIRNSRDTLAFQMKDTGGGWDKFLLRYGSPSDKCFSTDNGCILIMEEFDPADIGGSDIEECDSDTGCPYLDYNEDDRVFYNYSPELNTPPNSPFKRTVNMENINEDEVKITANIKWLNGDETIERTQTLTIYLLNWQK
ncbi:MAG: prepilin-type N-terminal cleavage/methylation domain-containing protein [Candidatus Paceibacterota bacterium]